MKKKILEAFSVGDRVVEKIARIRKKRIGEIVFIQDQNRRRLEMMQLNPHDLTPLRKSNMELKLFRLYEEQCKKLNEWKYNRKKTFQLGDIIRHRRKGRIRYGRIVSFVHPDGLYTDSNEHGYNGKDLIECVAIKGRDGLPRKRSTDGEVIRFAIEPKHTKVCEVLPMDLNGGVRIKDYWEKMSKLEY